jgi:MFS family permease
MPTIEGAPTMTSPTTAATESDRPTQLLPISQLLRLSVYWLGLIAVVQGIGVILQERIKDLVPDPTIQYTTLGVIQAAGVLIAVLVQPIAGSISDYTISRFGRRKPYILVGTLLDVVFLIGIATSNTVLAVGAFVVLLQFSANFAQGPFQGYVPDLIPPVQVGLASGLVGLFTVLGVVVGTALASLGLAIGDFTIPTIALGLIELVTMLSLFFRLDEGRAAKDRGGRSWTSVAIEAWGRDVLRERSFMFLVASRFFVLGGGAFLIGLLVPYLERAQGITDPDERALLILVTTGIVALCTAISTIPAARLGDRFGRKRVIYVACLIAGAGMAVCALAPGVPIFIFGAILMGVGTGSFLAVDWALMTEIIPKDSSGRYMGISNVATATNGVISAFIGGILVDALVSAGNPTLGPRVAFLLAPVWFTLGALLLRPVVEPARPAGRFDTATG